VSKHSPTQEVKLLLRRNRTRR